MCIILSLNCIAQSERYIPFQLDEELRDVFQYKDSTFLVHEVGLYDTVTKTLLFENTGFVALAKYTNDRIRFDCWVYVSDTERIQFATSYLIMSDSCYEFIQAYDGRNIKVKSIEATRKLPLYSQMGELFLGMLFADHKKYLTEYLLLGDRIKTSPGDIGVIYSMQSYAFSLQGILGRNDKGYFITGKKLASTATTKCKIQ